MTENPTVVHMTPEDLLQMPEGERFELIDGLPVEKKLMGAESGESTSLLNALLTTYVRLNRLGHVYDGSVGIQCFPDDPGRVRKPDISFVASGRLANDKSPKGHIKIAPDLAVEVVSPNDLYSEVEGKVLEYLAAGVRLVWVVNPATRIVHIHRPDGTTTRLTETDTLSGETVVPGFTCRVAELFA